MSFTSVRVSRIPTNEKIIKVRTNEELKLIIAKEIDRLGYNCSLNHIDVSAITDFSNAFTDVREFNGDISEWDVSNGVSFAYMFHSCAFNGTILKWDMKSAKNLEYMFARSNFNNDISIWDTSNVINMQGMFAEARFNKDISLWDVSNVCNMSYMFYTNMDFAQDISGWNVNKCICVNTFHRVPANTTSRMEFSYPAWFLRQKRKQQQAFAELDTVFGYTNTYKRLSLVDNLKKLNVGQYDVYCDIDSGQFFGSKPEIKKTIKHLYGFEIKENMSDSDYLALGNHIKKLESIYLKYTYRTKLVALYPSVFVEHLHPFIERPNPHDDGRTRIREYFLDYVNYHATRAGYPGVKLINGKLEYTKQ